jgi:release factor glutamine methyltransferase
VTQDLPAVRDAVELSAYPEVLAGFTPEQLRPHAWAEARDNLPAAEAALVSFLLLTEPVTIDALPPEIAAVVPALVAAGVCDERDHNVRLKGLALVDVYGMWVFVQQPQIAPTLYFGDDSLALIRHVRPRRDGNALDLCSGPGTQALVASLWSAKVVAVEINPVAVGLAMVNVAMNDRSLQITIRQGDLYSAVGAEKFDTIIANPPLVPIPAELPYPFVGAGGVQGLDIVWRILDGAPDHLTESGSLHLLGTTLSDGFLPVADRELAELCRRRGLDVLVTLTAHVPLGPDSWWSRAVGSTIAALTGEDVGQTVKILDNGYRSSGASHICAYFLRARRGSGALRILDLSTGAADSFWYV